MRKKTGKNLRSVFWQFYDQRRRKLYPTLLGGIMGASI